MSPRSGREPGREPGTSGAGGPSAPIEHFEARAWSWVHHLREGGTSTWADWLDRDAPGVPPPAYGVPLPGAAQLELLRLLSLRAADSPDTTEGDLSGLADTVLAVSGPGRGLPELPLPGAPLTSSSGPRPVPMDQLPAAELVRVASGVLVSLLLRHEGVPPVRDTGGRQPWRRAVKVTGAPQTVDSLRAQLRQQGWDDAGPLEAAVVVALPIDVMAAEVWAHRTLRGSEVKWGRFWAAGHGEDQLPVYADPAALALKWADRLGPERVTVVSAPGRQRAAQLMGQVFDCTLDPAAVGHMDLDVSCVEVVRGVNAALQVATGEQGRREATRTLRRLLATATRLRDLARGDLPSAVDVVPAPPAQLRGWLTEMADESRAVLAESGCRVVGDLGDLAPRPEEGLPEGPEDTSVLHSALTACLTVAHGVHGVRRPHGGGSR